MQMESSFDPNAIERELYREWEEAGYFEPNGNGPPYCIAIPPPNVTGSLHMGHAFQHTLIDALIRHQRMKGRRTLWQMGTDHAGIATQMLVDRKLAAEGIAKEQLGREGFVARVWEWRRESGGEISRQLRRMGSSVSWQRDRFTMDEGFSRAVREVFVRLFDEGLVYRGQRLVNWDPELETAISDLEVENAEEDGHLWHLRYPLCDGATTADGKRHLVVATTRPETMLGDTAVAVHPGDERYAGLVGRRVRLPLVEREIPIVADEHVDPAFGTGCVKITPAHDFDDYEVGQRHDLPLVNVFTPDAKINENGPAAYRGLDRFEARARIVEDLEAAGLLDSVKAHKLTVPRGDRSNAVIEPYLTEQWFVRIQPLANPAVEAVRDGRIEFVPKQYENLYFAWMRDIRDWCVSRQQWWGHRIPAWYDDEGNVYAAHDEDAVRAKYGLPAGLRLRQDPDVLETWFSSALWTFGTLGWPDETAELELYHPTDVLVTGYDIIFFWVARMIMMTLKFVGEVPFRKVYIHGLVLDAEGEKMSKTRGNGLDPLDLVDGIGLDALVAKRTENLVQPQLAARIEKATRRDFPNGIPAYGADALRFTFCAMASTGRDIRFDLKRIEGYRHFCNKLWNAAKFVVMNTAVDDLDGEVAPTLADRWIVSRARKMIEAAERALATYRFDLYANAVYDFFWHEYCDWYLELTKPVLWDESADPKIRRATRRCLLEVLEISLRAAHPIVPYITETIWRRVAPRAGIRGETIMLQPFPEAGELAEDPAAEADIEWLKGVVIAVRNIRGEMKVKPGQTVDVVLHKGAPEDRARSTATAQLVKRLAGVASLDWLPAGGPTPVSSMQLVGDMEVHVPLAGLIDLDAERGRLDKEIDRKASELERVRSKLTNESFVARAPAAVVEKEREKAADADRQLAALRAQRRRLDAG